VVANVHDEARRRLQRRDAEIDAVAQACDPRERRLEAADAHELGDLGREQLIARGLPAAEVDRVIRLVDLSEYKRRQNPPGPKVTSKAFGRDRRVPITNRYGG
jgi:NH3-dependent NAD+ synthetase